MNEYELQIWFLQGFNDYMIKNHVTLFIDIWNIDEIQNNTLKKHHV